MSLLLTKVSLTLSNTIKSVLLILDASLTTALTPDPVKPSTPASPEKRKKYKQKVFPEMNNEVAEDSSKNIENIEKESDNNTITVEISQTVNVETAQNETEVSKNNNMIIIDDKKTQELPFEKTIDVDTLAANYTTKELKQFGKDLGISLSGKKADMAKTILNNM